MPSGTLITDTIDFATGEKKRSEKNFITRYKSQPFVSISLPASDMLHAVANKDTRVLLALAELAEFNTNAVFLVASRRLQVMTRAAVTSTQLSNCLKRLRDAGIISGGKGEAIIHPAALWKGESAVKKEKLAAMAPQVKSNFDNE